MCYYYQISKYNCGHEEASAQGERSEFCLFEQRNGICSRELGNYRLLDIVVDDWCGRCLATLRPLLTEFANAQAAYVPNGPPPPPLPEARITPSERAEQGATRWHLRQAAHVPERAPPQKRLGQLNSMAHANLEIFLQNGAAYAARTFAWVIRYIASLPWWLDRKGLMDELEPWFAELLDEEHQIVLRAALRSLGCEGALDNVMVWRRTA